MTPSRSMQLLAILALVASCTDSSGGRRSDAGDGGADGAVGAFGDAGVDSGAASCPMVSGCGGDVVGNWRVTESCVTLTQDLSDVCAGISAVTMVTLTATSISYNADLTYDVTRAGGGATRYLYPASCLRGATCAEIGAGVKAVGKYDSVTCGGTVNGGCTCDALVATTPAVETGTYTATGAVLATTHGGVTDTATYCVEGSVMHQVPVIAKTTVMGSIALTKL